MSANINATHDPERRSWVESANDPVTDFPLQNLPFGVFQSDPTAPAHIGVAIGDSIADLSAMADAGLLPPSAADACHESTLNRLMALPPRAVSGLRARLSELFGADTCPEGEQRSRTESCLVSQRNATMLLPVNVGDYTDFYASVFHATNVGALFRPDNPLLPNYKWVPIGYHGRSSSLVVSGTSIRRPAGQLKPADAAAPEFRPTDALDYELELGAYVAGGNAQGSVIRIIDAPAHLFGVSLLNDWSARDIQSWEYQPLGPFLGKNFATSLSPWVVTFEALAPFRHAAFARPAGDPAPLPYLNASSDQSIGSIAMKLEVHLLTARMRSENRLPVKITEGSVASMYWTFAQLLTHHASNGCNLRPGDLLGSGTISGPEKTSRGCLLELTSRGREPLVLPDGETRQFLLDGDEVILRGFAEREGFRRIGLGECRGIVLPAHA